MHSKSETVELATAVTMAWLGNAHTRPDHEDVPAFLRSLVAAIAGISEPRRDAAADMVPQQEYTPAVSVRASLANPNRIISLIDGKPYASLNRHLKDNKLTPVGYRQRYGLKSDYPMVAPGYSALRSETSKRLGLGRKKGSKLSDVFDSPTASVEPATKRRGAKAAAEAKAAAKSHLGG